MNMLVKGYRTSGFYLKKVDGIGVGVDQLREKSGCDFLGGDVGKMFKNRCIHDI